MATGLSIAIQILRGLRTLHELPVVHQDLKPANVLLFDASTDSQTRYYVKLIDFGCASSLDDANGLIGQHNGIGTPVYMAPRQFVQFLHRRLLGRQESLATPTFDLWAFGLMLAELAGPVTANAFQEYQKELIPFMKNTFHQVEQNKELVLAVEKTIEADMRRLVNKIVEAAANITVDCGSGLTSVLTSCFSEEGCAVANVYGTLCQAYCTVLAGQMLPEVSLKDQDVQDQCHVMWNHFTPLEHEARYFDIVAGDVRRCAKLLLEQLALTLGETDPLSYLLEKEGPEWRHQLPPSCVPLLLDLLRVRSSLPPGSLPSKDAVALACRMQQSWDGCTEKRDCSRRLGTTWDSDSPFLQWCRIGVIDLVRGVLANGSYDSIRQLLSDRSFQGWTALFIAAGEGHLECEAVGGKGSQVGSN